MTVRPCILIVRDNKVLLMKYNYSGNDVYALPGGNPKSTETPEETLVRELKEELTLEVKVNRLLLAGEVIIPEKSRSTLHCVFLGKIISGTPRINPEHSTALECEWKDISQLDLINMYPNVGKYIKEIMLGNRPLKSLYIGKIEQNWF